MPKLSKESKQSQIVYTTKRAKRTRLKTIILVITLPFVYVYTIVESLIVYKKLLFKYNSFWFEIKDSLPADYFDLLSNKKRRRLTNA